MVCSYNNEFLNRSIFNITIHTTIHELYLKYIVLPLRYHEHDVDDDVVDCVDEFEEKCESITQGYSTTEECTKWPIRKCNVQNKKTKKYSPVTECKKVPFELCGSGACPVEPGAEECQERRQTVRILSHCNLFHRITKL